MQFNLVCERAWLKPLSNSAYMVGMFFGASLLGDLADRIGRRKGFLISSLLLSIGGILSSFSVNYYMFLIMRFITGMGGVSVFAITYVLGKSK